MKILFLFFLFIINLSVTNSQTKTIEPMSTKERLYYLVHLFGSKVDRTFCLNPDKWIEENSFIEKFPSLSFQLLKYFPIDNFYQELAVEYTIRGNSSGQKYLLKSKLPGIIDKVLNKTAIINSIKVAGDDHLQFELEMKFNHNLKNLLAEIISGKKYTSSGIFSLGNYDKENEILELFPQFPLEFFQYKEGEFDFYNTLNNNTLPIPISPYTVETAMKKDKILYTPELGQYGVFAIKIHKSSIDQLMEKAKSNDPKNVMKTVYYSMIFSIDKKDCVDSEFKFKIYSFNLFAEKEMISEIYSFVGEEK